MKLSFEELKQRQAIGNDLDIFASSTTKWQAPEVEKLFPGVAVLNEAMEKVAMEKVATDMVGQMTKPFINCKPLIDELQQRADGPPKKKLFINCKPLTDELQRRADGKTLRFWKIEDAKANNQYSYQDAMYKTVSKSVASRAFRSNLAVKRE